MADDIILISFTSLYSIFREEAPSFKFALRKDTPRLFKIVKGHYGKKRYEKEKPRFEAKRWKNVISIFFLDSYGFFKAAILVGTVK